METQKNASSDLSAKENSALNDQEETESKEQNDAEIETAFREKLSPAQRRTILGRMTKEKKTRKAAGNEMSDEEVAELRLKMIKEMLAK